MKKITILMCILIIFSNEGIAQWKFSAIAGPQLATFGGSDKKDWGGLDANPKMVVRFHAGILAERRHSEKIAFITGLLFSSKGTKYANDVADFAANNQKVEVSYIKVLSYLDLPLLLRYYKSEKWSFLIGPQVSYLLAAKVKNNDNAQRLYEIPATEDAKDSYTKFDVGINVGATYNLNEKMAIMLLYQYGIVKIGLDQVYNNNGGFEDAKAAIFNRVLLLSLLYKFKEQ